MEMLATKYSNTLSYGFELLMSMAVVFLYNQWMRNNKIFTKSQILNFEVYRILWQIANSFNEAARKVVSKIYIIGRSSQNASKILQKMTSVMGIVAFLSITTGFILYMITP